ncbi:MAG: DUF3825 domain-containing protein [Maritimibacter sp.]|nr:DUF3825 domain-containing protein [Maritimibacter sp.]
MPEFTDRLLDLAFIPDADGRFEELAELAEEEDWGYRNSPEPRPNPVLFNYIVFTYKRLVEEHKVEISPDGQSITFNTGLVTENQEEIFFLGNVNRIPDRQPWHFQGWYKRSAQELSVFPTLPDLAEYFSDPSVLVFDPRKDFRPNIDHIIDDNKERFPPPFDGMESFALRNFLSGAIEAVKIRLQRNYKTAIPQYYNGRMQILLPLCLSDPRVADLALAIEDRGGSYRAATCLTLDMAYNNARQLARPDRDWLQP